LLCFTTSNATDPIAACTWRTSLATRKKTKQISNGQTTNITKHTHTAQRPALVDVVHTKHSKAPHQRPAAVGVQLEQRKHTHKYQYCRPEEALTVALGNHAIEMNVLSECVN